MGQDVGQAGATIPVTYVFSAWTVGQWHKINQLAFSRFRVVAGVGRFARRCMPGELKGHMV